MEIVFTAEAKGDIEFFKKAGERKILKKIRELIISIDANPFEGLGKPESLKHDFQGCWSRRINKEHRLVYKITNQTITIISTKDHYK